MYFEINISSRYTYPIVDLASYLKSQDHFVFAEYLNSF